MNVRLEGPLDVILGRPKTSDWECPGDVGCPGLFTKNKERIQKCKKTGDSKHIYRNELDKACFQQDIAYWDFKDLSRITASDKTLRHNAFNITKNPKYDGYQRDLASMVYKVLIKKTLAKQLNLWQIKNLWMNLINQLLRN